MTTVAPSAATPFATSGQFSAGLFNRTTVIPSNLRIYQYFWETVMDHEVLLGGEMIGGAHECLLLKEMCHRVNNELASVIGIVSAALTRSRELETQRVLGNVMDRLHDHASLYSALQLPHERGAIAKFW
jgi:two-component sensor histidine kinase